MLARLALAPKAVGVEEDLEEEDRVAEDGAAAADMAAVADSVAEEEDMAENASPAKAVAVVCATPSEKEKAHGRPGDKKQKGNMKPALVVCLVMAALVASVYPVPAVSPDIKANGAGGTVRVDRGAPLSVAVSLVGEDLAGVDSDWWCAASTPFGWYCYDHGGRTWARAGSSYADISPAYQGPLLDISQFQVLNTDSLPPGSYRAYFGFDTDLNGSPDLGRAHYDSVAVVVGGGVSTRLSGVEHWTYNIQDVSTQRQRDELVGTHFDMYVLEPVVTEKGNENFDIAALVRDIRGYNIDNYGKDPIILAYVDIGQAEDWRWYWQDGWGVGNPGWIAATDPDGWEGNYPVAYWYQDWEDIVIYGSGGRSQVKTTLQAGFDGIYLDWVEAFDDDDVAAKAAVDGEDPASAMFDLIEKIRVYARALSPNADPDYLVVAQNAAGLYGEDPARYLQLIDGIALEGIWYDGDGGFDNWGDPRGYNVPTNDLFPNWTEEVLALLRPMKGKLPIFCVEYAQDIGGAGRATEVYTVLAPGEGFIPYCSRRSLARLSTTPYPAGYAPQDY